MNREQAIEFLQGRLDCMNKCDVFERTETHADECDSCDYCYTQGNFGEQQRALEFAIKYMREQKNES